VARVLLIDEIESTREGITAILRRLGHQVEAKVSPDVASEWLRTHMPDVIFLAGRALAWSPVRALEQVRSIQRPPPVVWLASSPPGSARRPRAQPKTPRQPVRRRAQPRRGGLGLPPIRLGPAGAVPADPRARARASR